MDSDQARQAVVGRYQRSASKTYAMRTVLKNESFVAFREAVKANDFNEFKKHMKPIERLYRRVSLSPKKRVIHSCKRIVKCVLPAGAVSRIKNLMGRS